MARCVAGGRSASRAGRHGLAPIARAIGAALGLRYLQGGGPGCSYPEERPSAVRRVFHGLVFWGFACDFVSTTLAYLYQDWLRRLPPYALSSAPVVFGAVGGLGLLAGSAGLIWCKLRSDRAPMAKGAVRPRLRFSGHSRPYGSDGLVHAGIPRHASAGKFARSAPGIRGRAFYHRSVRKIRTRHLPLSGAGQILRRSRISHARAPESHGVTLSQQGFAIRIPSIAGEC